MEFPFLVAEGKVQLITHRIINSMQALETKQGGTELWIQAHAKEPRDVLWREWTGVCRHMCVCPGERKGGPCDSGWPADW